MHSTISVRDFLTEQSDHRQASMPRHAGFHVSPCERLHERNAASTDSLQFAEHAIGQHLRFHQRAFLRIEHIDRPMHDLL